mgnify:CR=1 FL=1
MKIKTDDDTTALRFLKPAADSFIRKMNFCHNPTRQYCNHIIHSTVTHINHSTVFKVNYSTVNNLKDHCHPTYKSMVFHIKRPLIHNLCDH